MPQYIWFVLTLNSRTVKYFVFIHHVGAYITYKMKWSFNLCLYCVIVNLTPPSPPRVSDPDLLQIRTPPQPGARSEPYRASGSGSRPSTRTWVRIRIRAPIKDPANKGDTCKQGCRSGPRSGPSPGPGPYSVRPVDPDPDPESGSDSGSRRANVPKAEKKL